MFDDGTRFNAAAVKVNLDRIADPKNVPLCPAAPMLAAWQFARPDHLTGGRIALHLIACDSDKELWRCGSDIGEDECDQRTKEYLGVAYQKRTRLLRRASLFMSKPIGGAMSGQ